MPVKKQLRGFFEFIRTQGVVGLAVGFVLGDAVSALVKSFVEDILEPLLGLLLGTSDGLEAATVNVFGATVMYGRFVSFFVDFLIIAAVVYFIFKGLKLDKLDLKKKA